MGFGNQTAVAVTLLRLLLGALALRRRLARAARLAHCSSAAARGQLGWRSGFLCSRHILLAEQIMMADVTEDTFSRFDAEAPDAAERLGACCTAASRRRGGRPTRSATSC